MALFLPLAAEMIVSSGGISFLFLWAESMIESAYACHQNTLAIAPSFSRKLGGFQNRTMRAERRPE